MASSLNPAKSARTRTHLVIVGAVALAAWELMGRALELRPDVLPTPSRIVLEISREYATLAEHALASCAALARGLSAALAFALALLFCCGRFGRYLRPAERLLSAALAIPFLAAAPVLVVWFGYGRTAEVLVVFLTAFPLLGAAVLRSMEELPREMLDLARAMRASRADVAMKVQLPWVFPRLLGSLKIAITASVGSGIAAEFVLGDSGFGALMLTAVSGLNTPLLIATFLGATSVAVLLRATVRLLECAWPTPGKDRSSSTERE